MLALLVACQSTPPAGRLTSPRQADSLAFEAYIKAGDSVYAQKQGYASFARSLSYYDSAQALANRSGDTLLLAEAIFAKGRVYDAWNKQPQQTIRYFAQAARLFRTLPGQYKRYVYTRHLVAHAYDKIKDSLNTVNSLQSLYQELRQKDTSLLRQIPYTAEMALVATEVRAYPLAQQILRSLTRRAWIRNSTSSYDYLNHYYLTQGRLDAFWRKPRRSLYLDSLQQVYRSSTKLMDKLYYAESMAPLYVAMGQYQTGAQYYSLAKALNERLNNRDEVNTLLQALLQSELLVEKHKLDYQRSLHTIYQTAIWLLGGLLALITLLSGFLYQRNEQSKGQARQLAQVNQQLDEKVAQVELLNKEIQHRVKNNLQMIYSLLQMQERKTDNEQTLTALQTARLRIDSLAALHQQLLNGQGNLDLGAYLKGLVCSVVDCLSAERNVVTHMTIDAVSLPVNSYLPLSLVLNEWVTNSIKYAQTIGRTLEITVSATDTAGAIRLDYVDNGQVPRAPSPSGLGLQIVSLLTRQMNATLITLADSPYHYQLSLPHGRQN